MDFGWSEPQELLRKEVRAFARTVLAPDAGLRAKKESIDLDRYRQIAELGIVGMGIPEEFGGYQAEWISAGIAIEELAKADFALASVARLQMMFCHLLMLGDAEIRKEWIPEVVAGRKLMAMCVTEPECGADAGAMRATAVPDGDWYVLNGEKTSVTLGMQADASLVWAKAPTQDERGAVTLFLVPLDIPGVHKSKIRDMGIQSVGRASLIFDDVRIPRRFRIGEEGEGFSRALEAFDTARIFLGLEAIAIAQTSLIEAMAYAKERTTFGTPIIKYQDISFAFAENATRIEAAKWLIYRALWLSDEGRPRTKEAAMAKWFAVDAALKAVHDSILTLGHVGFSEEYPLEQRLRDLIGWEIADSTPGIMKLVIARAIERAAEPFE